VSTDEDELSRVWSRRKRSLRFAPSVERIPNGSASTSSCKCAACASWVNQGSFCGVIVVMMGMGMPFTSTMPYTTSAVKVRLWMVECLLPY
jgi:hypothetical protein